MKIHKVTERRKLKTRREPYWVRIHGGYLGYRKTISGADSWIAKSRGRSRKVKQIGSLADLTYDEASDKAQEWLQELQTGISGGGTVEAALKKYIKHLAIEKTALRAADSNQKFSVVYGSTFGDTPLCEVTRQQVIDFRNGLLTEKRGKEAANRIFRTIKAGLSHAYRNGWCLSDRAWMSVKTFGTDVARRERVLSLKELKALWKQMDQDLRDYAQATYLTFSRSGDLADVTAKHFNAGTATVKLRTLKGKGGEVRYREVPLSDAALAIFKRRAMRKIGDALLFDLNGLYANKTERARQFRTACDKAGLPDDVVLTTLRHTSISRALSQGKTASQVAGWAGTSAAMIERNYQKFLRAEEMRHIQDVKLL